MDNVTLLAAFGAGLLSFISPCVLPIVPGYLSFISGVSIDELQKKQSKAVYKVFLNSLFFVLGFSVVFIALGASATVVSGFLTDYMHIIGKVAGVVIIILGLHYIGLFKIKLLNYEKRFNMSDKKIGPLGAFFVGFAFAFGWTPCIGPILATILAIAAAEDTVWRGIILLLFYSAGLAIPFLLTALAFNAFISVSSKIKKHFRIVEIIGGVFLILVGLLIFTDSLSYLSGMFSQWFPWLELG
ncbi:MAG: cytochrome c biogenesis protein CcdA [candidate division Zixibacteria bacterium]|nr:cytochrome c biogenesis protein CcdA [candidate division Zixibacteria bacterium]